MLLHALMVIKEEFNRHIEENYENEEQYKAELGNVADILLSGKENRNRVYFSIVNIKEEKTLKNVQHRAVNSVSLNTIYENPPVFVNLLTMISAPHEKYNIALLAISRVILFFQSKNVFTHDNVSIDSVMKEVVFSTFDRLESFKLILDIYSPSLEEVNHLWGTLGGKQYPFVLYMLRMIDLKFKNLEEKDNLIKEIVSNFSVKRQ